MKTKRRIYKKNTKIKRKQKTKKQRIRNQRKITGGDLDPAITNIVNISIQNRDNNHSRMLNLVCKNSDNCLALGVYGSYIKQYFENFRNLSLVDTIKMKHIGRASKNGFIIEIPFSKNNFTAYTALKCAAKQHSDNLFYEYYIGKFFINSYLNIFPCFVETYDCYTFNDESDWYKLQNFTNPADISLPNMITRKPISDERISDESISENNYEAEDAEMFGRSCMENKRLCVLIQHFDNFTSVYDKFHSSFTSEANVQYEKLNILYQVYFPLTVLKDVYTHYDLHANNVFLYKPYQGNKYIQMRYHLLSERVIEFPSEYIVKIIDYGRNYFDNGVTNTKEILNNYVCNNRMCNPNCGYYVGYGVIQGNEYNPNAQNNWIFPNQKNISHDLKFAHYFYSYLKQIKLFNTFFYNDMEITGPSEKLMGTPEKLGGNSLIINNIVNLREAIESFIDVWNTHKMKKKYDSTWKQMAVMDIYEDKRPYKFELLPDKS
jgi:hypothetical protein